MKRIFLFLFAALCTANSLRAYDFQSGDLYYNIINDTVAPYEVEVTYQYNNTNNYSGLTAVMIPTSVVHNGETYAVTKIGDIAFCCCTGFDSITIPESVTSIGSSAFAGCTGFSSMTIPQSVESIGSSAFAECYNLADVHIEGAASIGDEAFRGCSSLTKLVCDEAVSAWDSKGLLAGLSRLDTLVTSARVFDVGGGTGRYSRITSAISM